MTEIILLADKVVKMATVKFRVRLWFDILVHEFCLEQLFL